MIHGFWGSKIAKRLVGPYLYYDKKKIKKKRKKNEPTLPRGICSFLFILLLPPHVAIYQMSIKISILPWWVASWTRRFRNRVSSRRELLGERNLSELECVRIRSLPLFEEIGNCQNWKVSELENVRVGKCQNWKLSESESVRIWIW